MVFIDKALSNKLANMGFLCALLVLLIHCPDASTGHNDILKRALKWVMPGALKSVANSYFFLAAGFFIGGHVLSKGWYVTEVRKRFHSLFIPYVVLNLTWFACMALYQHGNIRFGAGDAHPVEMFDIARALGFASWGNPLIGPLWFVKTLLVFVLSLPLFSWIILRGKVSAYFLCGVVFLFVCISGTLGWTGGVLLTYKPYGILYFLMGCTFRLYGIPTVSRGFALSLLAICMGIKATINLTFEPIDNANLSGAMWFLDFIVRPGMLLGAWTLVPDVAWPKVLTGNAFPIYAIHGVFVRMSFIVFGKLKIHDAFFGSFFWSVVYICAMLFITIGLAQLLRRNVVTAKLFLGGR